MVESPLLLFKQIAQSFEDTQTQVVSRLEPSLFHEKNGDGKNECYRGRVRRLEDDEVEAVVRDIKQFAEYLQLENLEAVAFICVFARELLNNHDESVEESIGEYLRLSPFDLLLFKTASNRLSDLGYVRHSVSRRSVSVAVDVVLKSAILNNGPFAISQKKPMDRYGFCQEVGLRIKKMRASDMNIESYLSSIQTLEAFYAESIPFVNKICEIVPVFRERAMLYDICNDFLEGSSSELEPTIEVVSEDISERMRWMRRFHDEGTILQKNDLIEMSPASFLGSEHITLTTKTEKLLLENDYFESKKKKNVDVLEVETIGAKNMFYEAETKRQIDFLRSSVENSKFCELQERLAQRNLPKGVAAIFYGAPGTGKTETALQIAKATGRKVMHVDISHSKSCFFGESEKLVKKIFSNYKALCEAEERTPILLFNEADAIFSKRKKSDSSNLAQTENAIQNIILEQLESFDGILLATTNLADNLDPAFERRFLFKVRFERPSLEAKRNIWKDKIPSLSDEECSRLAESYDLSGGEIDNVVRKSTMREVLYGAEPSFDSIDVLCRDERFASSQNRKSVGF